MGSTTQALTVIAGADPQSPMRGCSPLRTGDGGSLSAMTVNGLEKWFSLLYLLCFSVKYVVKQIKISSL